MSDAMSIAMPGRFAQPARWRAFRDPSVEASFRVWHRDRILPIGRLVGFAAIVLFAQVPVSYLLIVGQPPKVLLLSCYAVACPVAVGLMVSSFTRLRRWANEIFTAGNVVTSLAIVWPAHVIFSPASGAVVCGVLTGIFYPLIFRVRTGATAVAVVILTAVTSVLMITSVRQGELPMANAWFYFATLLTAPLIVIAAAGLIEANMRKQFVSERTVAIQQDRLQASQRLLRRYAPAAVADRIESGDAEAVGRPQRVRVTALSSDVVGFTELADRVDPESLSEIIDDYVTTMSQAVELHGGVVTEFAGDGLMAIFGAPEALPPDEQVLHALATAQEMSRRLGLLNESWYRLGIEQPLHVRIGINTGMLSVGTFGSDGRATYTAIGLQMNVAARIQAHCEPGHVLLSGASWHLVKDAVECEPRGEVTVKGVHFPISIYTPSTPGDQ